VTIHPADQILDLYRRHAAAWSAARSTDLFERDWMDRFEALLPPAGRILDLGCGSGAPIATHFAANGHHITGVDGSEAMAAAFHDRLPGQTALVADMRTLALQAHFDGILAWNSLFHLRAEDQRAMMDVFAHHAAPGTAVMFTTGSESGEALGQLEGETLYHASLDPETYRTLLDEAGFDIVDHRITDEACRGHTVWLARYRSQPRGAS
jgi:SAM-dependent methyltransferase